MYTRFLANLNTRLRDLSKFVINKVIKLGESCQGDGVERMKVNGDTGKSKSERERGKWRQSAQGSLIVINSLY